MNQNSDIRKLIYIKIKHVPLENNTNKIKHVPDFID